MCLNRLVVSKYCVGCLKTLGSSERYAVIVGFRLNIVRPREYVNCTELSIFFQG